MGAGASIDVDPKTLTADQIAEFIGSLGVAYEKYKLAVIENGLDGSIVSTLNDSELNEFLDELKISSTIHRRIILTNLKNIFQSKDISSPVNQQLAVTNPPPDIVTDTNIPVQLKLPSRTGKETHVFLTHNWSNDELGRNNHHRVMAMNSALKSVGFITWFDEERMNGSIRRLMTEGNLYQIYLILCISSIPYPVSHLNHTPYLI